VSGPLKKASSDSRSLSPVESVQFNKTILSTKNQRHWLTGEIDEEVDLTPSIPQLTAPSSTVSRALYTSLSANNKSFRCSTLGGPSSSCVIPL